MELTVEQIKKCIGHNRKGWYALRRDRWWVGDAKGVLCYMRLDVARIALTIACARDDGKVNYFIDTFDGILKVDAGTYTPKLSAEAGLKAYEEKAT